MTCSVIPIRQAIRPIPLTKLILSLFTVAARYNVHNSCKKINSLVVDSISNKDGEYSHINLMVMFLVLTKNLSLFCTYRWSISQKVEA